jgi:hypothetical protein
LLLRVGREPLETVRNRQREPSSLLRVGAHVLAFSCSPGEPFESRSRAVSVLLQAAGWAGGGVRAFGGAARPPCTPLSTVHHSRSPHRTQRRSPTRVSSGSPLARPAPSATARTANTQRPLLRPVAPCVLRAGLRLRMQRERAARIGRQARPGSAGSCALLRPTAVRVLQRQRERRRSAAETPVGRLLPRGRGACGDRGLAQLRDWLAGDSLHMGQVGGRAGGGVGGVGRLGGGWVGR